MQRQEMTLNIRYDAPPEVWDKVSLIYSMLDGWLGAGGQENAGETGIPYWFGFNEEEKHICASVEPSGIQFTALMDNPEWETWCRNIKHIATEVLGYKVGEVALGEVDE